MSKPAFFIGFPAASLASEPERTSNWRAGELWLRPARRKARVYLNRGLIQSIQIFERPSGIVVCEFALVISLVTTVFCPQPERAREGWFSLTYRRRQV
jgi:hypothetical protein